MEEMMLLLVLKDKEKFARQRRWRTFYTYENTKERNNMLYSEKLQ